MLTTLFGFRLFTPYSALGFGATCVPSFDISSLQLSTMNCVAGCTQMMIINEYDVLSFPICCNFSYVVIFHHCVGVFSNLKSYFRSCSIYRTKATVMLDTDGWLLLILGVQCVAPP